MTQTKPGEVYWVDLGLAGKIRPMMVVSHSDDNPPRDMSVLVPLTTEIRGGDYEVSMPRVRWLPGTDESVANVQGLIGIPHPKLLRKSGQYEAPIVAKVRDAIAWMLELKNPPAQLRS